MPIAWLAGLRPLGWVPASHLRLVTVHPSCLAFSQQQCAGFDASALRPGWRAAVGYSRTSWLSDQVSGAESLHYRLTHVARRRGDLSHSLCGIASVSAGGPITSLGHRLTALRLAPHTTSRRVLGGVRRAIGHWVHPLPSLAAQPLALHYPNLDGCRVVCSPTSTVASAACLWDLGRPYLRCCSLTTWELKPSAPSAPSHLVGARQTLMSGWWLQPVSPPHSTSSRPWRCMQACLVCSI